jgi:translation initiation factor 1
LLDEPKTDSLGNMADKPFHNPFAALAHLRGESPPEAEAPQLASEPTVAPAADVQPIARAVVRLERTGRGGKEVTIIDHLDLRAAALERWLKELKSALGCGGVIENGAMILQGDHRKRLPPLLTARGVRKVTVSN